MATAREALLEAAFTALAARPWSGVRMVDVAAAARVSRQTLYNEFGSKDGLARALVRRAADGYLAGVERTLADWTGDADAGVHDRLLAVAEWTVGAARANPLVRALLTGCWGEWLPTPRPVRSVLTVAASPVPAQRRADAGSPGPAELAAAVRDRALVALKRRRTDERTNEEVADIAYRCELTVRLALSYVVAPTASREDFARLLRTALGGPGVSSPRPRAGDR